MGAITRTLPLTGTPPVFGDEANYFIIQTTTPGTGVAGHAAPVQADLATKPLIHLFNGGTRTIVPDYIKVRITAVGAGATTTDLEVWTDYPLSSTTAPATTRTGGGTLMSPAINTQSNSRSNSGAGVYFGAVTATSVNAKRTGHSRVRSVVPVVEDQYLVVFGTPSWSLFSALPTTGTAQLVALVPFAPVTIGPGANFQFSEWGTSQSGAHSFDLELGYWECL